MFVLRTRQKITKTTTTTDEDDDDDKDDDDYELDRVY